MQHFVLIEADQENDSPTRADEITKRLWDLVDPKGNRPVGTVTTKLFPEIKLNDGSVALQVDLAYKIKVRDGNAADNLALMFPNLEPTEKANLIAHIKNNTEVTFSDLLPSNTVIKTYADLIQEGLLTEPNY